MAQDFGPERRQVRRTFKQVAGFFEVVVACSSCRYCNLIAACGFAADAPAVTTAVNAFVPAPPRTKSIVLETLIVNLGTLIGINVHS